MLNFKSDLNKSIKTGLVNEVRLFSEMANLLTTTGHPSIYLSTGITHQKYVYYESKYLGKKKKVEISDLLIISFVKNKPDSIKINFLQNKYIHKKSALDFTGDCFQYELLNFKPNIEPIKIKFPENILSFSKYSSITAYGLFYHDNSEINMSYSITTFLTAFPIIPAKGKTNFKLQIRNLGSYIKNNIGKELVATDQINSFVDALVNGQIGVPIHENFEIQKFIYSILNLLKSQTTNSILSENVNTLISEMAKRNKDLTIDELSLDELPNLLVVNREI